ncbi:hypothetical protein QUA71_21675 [Microcoleus sp. MON1_C5]
MDIINQAQQSESLRIKRIWALGTRGKVKNVEFEARRDSQGRYVLNHRHKLECEDGEGRNRAVNKQYMLSLDEAWDLLKTNLYVIHLTGCEPRSSRSLRKPEELNIEFE